MSNTEALRKAAEDRKYRPGTGPWVAFMNGAEWQAAQPAPALVPLTDEQIEALALKHEDFGFGQVDASGLTTHGFSPSGLAAFARAIEAAHGITAKAKP